MMKTTTRPTGDGWRLFLRLLPIIGIVWIHLFLRLHNIGTSLPYFIDEIRHIDRARIVWTFQDIHVSTTPSKFATYYWIGLFHIPEFPDPWIGRTPVALFSILGVAGTFALSKILFNRNTGLLAASMVAVWPFLVFFERLALTDPPTAAVAVITMWWSVMLAKRPTTGRAWVLGWLISLMIAGKLLSFPLLIGPFLAVAFFGSQPIQLRQPLWPQIKSIWQAYWPYIWRAASVFIIVWTAIMGLYMIRRLFDPSIRYIVDSYMYAETLSGERTYVEQNIERVWQILYYHWSLLLIGLSLVALGGLWSRSWRYATFFLLLTLPMTLFIIGIAKELSTRYLTIIGHLCAVGIAGGIMTIFKDWQPPRFTVLRSVPLALVGVWVFAFAVPFAYHAIVSPAELALPDRDRVEYFRNYTGWAVPEAFAIVVEDGAPPQNYDQPVVMAAMRICDHHPYYFLPTDLRGQVTVTCQPRIEGEGVTLRFERRYDWINAEAEAYGLIYVVAEQIPNKEGPVLIDPDYINGDVRLMGRFDRPFDGIPIDVYEVNTRRNIWGNQDRTIWQVILP